MGNSLPVEQKQQQSNLRDQEIIERSRARHQESEVVPFKISQGWDDQEEEVQNTKDPFHYPQIQQINLFTTKNLHDLNPYQQQSQYSQYLIQSQNDLQTLFKQLHKFEKKRINEVKEQLKTEVKNVIKVAMKECRTKKAKQFVEQIRKIEGEIKSLDTDLIAQQFKICSKIDDIVKELARFLNMKPEERQKMIMDMREEHNSGNGTHLKTDPDKPVITYQSEIPTPSKQKLSRALNHLPDIYVSGQKLLSNFEQLGQNKEEIDASNEIICNANQLYINLFNVKSKLNGFIFSMDNAHSVLAYVEPGASEAQFVVDQVVCNQKGDAKNNEVDLISLDLSGRYSNNQRIQKRLEDNSDQVEPGQSKPGLHRTYSITSFQSGGASTNRWDHGFTLQTDEQNIDTVSQISVNLSQKRLDLTSSRTTGRQNTSGNDQSSKSIQHKSIQKVNAILMKTLLDKQINKLHEEQLELLMKAKSVEEVCSWYLKDDRDQLKMSERAAHSEDLGFFALIKSLGQNPKGPYAGHLKLFQARKNLIQNRCSGPNTELLCKIEELGVQIHGITRSLSSLPTDIEVGNLSIKEYKQNAQRYVEQCQEFAKQIHELKQQLFVHNLNIEKIEVFLVEVRELISDADVIQMAEGVFQRVQMREIQKQFEHVQTQYKDVFNKIEQEMEQNAEDDYGSDDEEAEAGRRVGSLPQQTPLGALGSPDTYSTEQLKQDREAITQCMSSNRRMMKQRSQEIESLGNKLQQLIIKTCSNKSMLKQVDINYLTAYIRDAAYVIEQLYAWEEVVTSEASRVQSLRQKYGVVAEMSRSKSSKFAQGNFKLNKKGQMGMTARRIIVNNLDNKRGSAMAEQEISIKNSKFNLQNSNIKNDQLIILIKVYQQYYLKQRSMLLLAHRVVAASAENQREIEPPTPVLVFDDSTDTKTNSKNQLQQNSINIMNDFGVNAAGQRIGLKLEDTISIVAQTLSNLQSSVVGQTAQSHPHLSQQAILDQTGLFDIAFMLKQSKTKINRLEKRKNILIKELQSLKAYCVDKLDRALLETADEKSYLSGDDQIKVREIVKKLESFDQLIGKKLSTQISELLPGQLEKISWIGFEQDLENEFKDLQDALVLLQNVEMGLRGVDDYLLTIKDSVQICQSLVTRIKIQKTSKEGSVEAAKGLVDDPDGHRTGRFRTQATEFDLINYFKDQIDELVVSECQEIEDIQRISKKLKQIKKLTKSDFMISGKRFQIKQPPVGAINSQTKLTEIVVKIGVSSLNLKEFLLSSINEELTSESPYGNGVSCGLSNSDISHGLSSHYGKGLSKKGRSRRAFQAFQDACLSSPAAKLSRQGTGLQAMNWDQSSLGSSGSQSNKVSGLVGFKMTQTKLELSQGLRLTLKSKYQMKPKNDNGESPPKNVKASPDKGSTSDAFGMKRSSVDISIGRSSLLPPGSLNVSRTDKQFYQNKKIKSQSIKNNQHMFGQQADDLQSLGSQCSKDSRLSGCSGLSGLNGMSMGKGRLTALLNKNRLHDIQEAPFRASQEWIENNHLDNSGNYQDIEANKSNEIGINFLPNSQEKKILQKNVTKDKRDLTPKTQVQRREARKVQERLQQKLKSRRLQTPNDFIQNKYC